MTVYHQDERVTVWQGDCLNILPTLSDNSVDAVITDPPYGLEFMGKEWDKFKPTGPNRAASFAHHAVPLTPARGRQFGAWCELWAKECIRILKPGGHLLAFGGTRTAHRLACAIEDAGFEIRDSIGNPHRGGDANESLTGLLAWVYGSGFP